MRSSQTPRLVITELRRFIFYVQPIGCSSHRRCIIRPVFCQKHNATRRTTRLLRNTRKVNSDNIINTLARLKRKFSTTTKKRNKTHCQLRPLIKREHLNIPYRWHYIFSRSRVNKLLSRPSTNSFIFNGRSNTARLQITYNCARYILTPSYYSCMFNCVVLYAQSIFPATGNPKFTRRKCVTPRYHVKRIDYARAQF